MNPTVTCSHCGEERHDLTPDGQHIVPGQPAHDPKRCWAIAHAMVMETAGMGDETSHNIVELARWLQDHPNRPGVQRTSGAIQARRDREISLDRWVAVAQRQAGGKP
jgi:hypothetical protein